MAEIGEPRAEIVISGLGGEGDGIAEKGDERVFVPRALPGESLASDGAGGWALSGPASPERRVTALCPHFPACGGCTVQHMGDDLYRGWKSRLLAAAFAKVGLEVAPEPMISVPAGSRRRASLSGRRRDGGFVLGFHSAASQTIVPMAACAVLAEPIVRALPLLRRIGELAGPRPHGEVRLSVLAAREGLDVTLTAGRRVDERVVAELARHALAGSVIRLTWNGEPIIDATRPTVAMSGVVVTPPPGAFLQASFEAEAAMAAIVADAVPARTRRVADLFAGLGTFAFAVAPRAPVEAYDGDRRLIAAMSDAARRASRLKPIEGRVRDLYRDPLSPRELERFEMVVLDPPRAGAKAQAEAIAASGLKRVVAVSCNPATLARDVAILAAAGFEIERLVPVDQFLWTSHLEAVAVLRRP